MKDTDLYFSDSHTEPWFVEAVELDTAEGLQTSAWSMVLVFAGLPFVRESWLAATMPSLVSGAIWTRASSRRSCMLDSRVDCPEHGVLQVNVPWAESARFTIRWSD